MSPLWLSSNNLGEPFAAYLTTFLAKHLAIVKIVIIVNCQILKKPSGHTDRESLSLLIAQDFKSICV